MKLVVSLLFLMGLAGCQPKVQRFQIVVTQDGRSAIKLDTETGKSWMLQDDGNWHPIFP